MLPAQSLADGDVCVRVPPAVKDPLDDDAVRVVDLGVGVLQLADTHGVPGVAVGEGDLIAVLVPLALPPVSGEVDPPLGDVVSAHPLPVGGAVGYQDVGEDELPGRDQGLVDEGVVHGVDVLDDAEDAGLDVHRPGVPFIVHLDVDDVIPHNGLTWYHGGAGLAAGAREGPREVGHPVLPLRVDPHDEHVLRQPVLVVGPVDGEAEGQLLQTQAVAGVLVVDRVDLPVHVVDVDAPLVDVLRGVPLVELAGGVDEGEEVG